MLYTFECDSDTGCGLIFDVKSTMNEISGLKPSCPSCQSNKHVIRNYSNIHMFGPNKTLGSLADKNTIKLSGDNREHLCRKHTEYLRKPFEGKLPDGAELMR